MPKIKTRKFYKRKPLSEEHKKKLSLIKIGKPSNRKGKKCSEETKNKIGLANKGKIKTIEMRKKMSEIMKNNVLLGKCHLYKGGKSKKYLLKHTQGSEYKIWRKQVFERDNYICQKCGNKCKKGNPVVIHPHHIKSYTYFPEERYVVDNGITLCISCHHQTHWGH